MQPTDRDQLTTLGQNDVDLLQIRVPGHESGKACTLDSNSCGITESNAAYKHTERVRQDFRPAVSKVFNQQSTVAVLPGPIGRDPRDFYWHRRCRIRVCNRADATRESEKYNQCGVLAKAL